MALERYENGKAFAGLPRRLNARGRRGLAALRPGRGYVWAALIGLVRGAAAPRDLDSFLRFLRALDPIEVKLAMLGYHAPEFRALVEPDLFRQAAACEPRAVREFIRRTRFLEGSPGRSRLMRLDAAEMVGHVVGVLASLPGESYLAGPDVAAVLARSARDAAEVAAAGNAKVLVERMTLGLLYQGDVGVSEVMVVPTLIHRPFNLILDHDSSKIFCYPATRPRPGEPSPDERMVALYRSLGDETRLRILRRLVDGSTSLSLLSADLGLAKSTVHQHLLSLRMAGLVRLDLKTGYQLSEELPDLNGLLRAFLSGGPAKAARARRQ